MLLKGPVSVGIEVRKSFMNYKKGIYNDRNEPNCGRSLNHGVLLVGVDNSENNETYFIVKNSWSTSWGENGYIKIAKLSNRGVCGIANKMDVRPIV